MAKKVEIVEAQVGREVSKSNRLVPPENAMLELYAPGSKPLSPVLRPIFKLGQEVVIVDKGEFEKLVSDSGEE